MKDKVIGYLADLRERMMMHRDHKEVLADLFLEDGVSARLHEIRYDTFPAAKVTLTVEIYL